MGLCGAECSLHRSVRKITVHRQRAARSVAPSASHVSTVAPGRELCGLWVIPPALLYILLHEAARENKGLFGRNEAPGKELVCSKTERACVNSGDCGS